MPTATVACESWTQVPVHSCAAGSDHAFRCTYTGGTARLSGISGFFDVEYLDYIEGTCGSPAMPELVGFATGHIR